jgi:hypothetical protein
MVASRTTTVGSAVSASYRQRLVDAAGQGFISTPRLPAGRRIIAGILARGFRRPELSYPGDGGIHIRALYGSHRITRTFALNADGSLPDQIILVGMRLTADRMDAKRPGRTRKSRRLVAAPRSGHPIYVHHNNEQPKLHELVAAMPPAGGMAAYLAAMSSANDEGPAVFDKAA